MTKLPEPNFIERDAEKITQEWIDLYEKKTGKVLQPAQIERLMIDNGAYRETLLRVEIQKIAKENLLSYAPLDILEHIGEPLGVSKLLASSSKTIIRFSLDEVLDFDFVIPKGTEVETKDGLLIFVTNKSATITKGSTFVDVEAFSETAGSIGNNYTKGSINNLITPLPYISEVSNISVSLGGADDEDVESLRERIRQAPESFSNAGSKGAYKFHTLSAHQDITDVAILSSEPGIVEVYPLTKDGNPTQEILDTVQRYLSDDKIRPLTDKVIVKSPEKFDFSLIAEIILYEDADISSVMSTINTKLKEYKTLLAEKLGKDVISTQIISILNSVYGVFKVDLKAPSDIKILEYQWANIREIKVEVGGYANE